MTEKFWKLSLDDKVFTILIYVVLSIVGVIVLYPIVYSVSASFSNPMRVLNGDVWLLPKEVTLDAYKKVFEHKQIWNGYANTIKYTVIGVSVNLVLTVLAAYPLSRRDLKGRGIIMAFIVFTMFFQGGLIPLYMTVKELSLPNTLWALILPTAVSSFNLIVMRTFFMNTIPNELYDAAHVDGCSNTKLLLQVVLPLSKPILAVMFLFYAVFHWNSYFQALIYLSDSSKYPLQLVLRDILIQSSTQELVSADAGATERMLQSEGIKYAVIIVSSLPMLILYPFIQKFFAQGVMIGAVKG